MKSREYKFGPFNFDADRKVLFKDGSAVSIGRRGVSLLEALLKEEGRIVPKSALLEAAWPNETVEESNLSVQVASLRKHLGKPPMGGEWIATIERVGYQFISSDHLLGEEAHTHSGDPFFGGGLTTRSIAVLPFTNLNSDSDQQFISDGIAEDLRTELSRFRNLRVSPQQQLQAYRDHTADIHDTGRALAVEYVLAGSVRRIGSRFRISTQLVDILTGYQVWAEKYDIDQEQLFEVQDQLLRRITATLAGRLNAAEIEALTRKPPSSLAAYECVLRADALPQNDPKYHAEARSMFEHAIALDSGYARAYALLSINLEIEWEFDLNAPDSLLDRALDLAKKATALDAEDSVCHSSLCVVYLARRSHDLSEHHGLRALELNPNRTAQLASLGYLYSYMGQPEKGIKYFKQSKEIDPFFEPSWYWPGLGMAFFTARQYDNAADAMRRIAEPAYWFHAMLAACEAKLGNVAIAEYHKCKALRLRPDFSVSVCITRQPYKREGDRDHLCDALIAAGLPA